MLFSPEAHEALVEEPWNAHTIREAITAIVDDAETAFDDGWPLHPQDDDGDEASVSHLRTVYCGGAGVVDALYRLAQRGFVELRRDYVPYLERSLQAEPDFPTGTQSAACGRGKPESDWCCRGSRRRTRTSSGCRS
jgi:hypothetical protein